MKKELINTIITILNDSSSISKKREAIIQLYPRRRKRNKVLLCAIRYMLWEYALPSTEEDQFNVAFFSEMDEEHYEWLKLILQKSNCSFFNAVCSELLWLHSRRFEYLLNSLKEYDRELKQPSFESSHYSLRVRLSICRVYCRPKPKNYCFRAFFNNCLSWLEGQEEYGVIGNLVIALASCREEIEVLDRFAQSIFKRAVASGALAEIIYYGELLLEKFYVKAGTKCKDRQNICVEIARALEQLADFENASDSASFFRTAHLYRQAIDYWTKSESEGLKSQRERILVKLKDAEQAAMSSMHSFQYEIDTSDVIRHQQKLVEKASFEEVLLSMINLIPLQGPDTVIENSNKQFLTDIVSTSILDNSGRVRCIVPPRSTSGEEQLSWCEYKAAELYEQAAVVSVSSFIELAKRKYVFDQDALRFLVEDNLFVPEDRKESFLNGLLFGFNLKLPLAMAILMPQVENSIRRLMELSEIVVYKTNEKGAEEVLSLDTLLKEKKVIDCFEEKLLFNLRVFYTSEYGIGMRNLVCHGLLSDDEMQSARCLATWWFTFRLCCQYSRKFQKRIVQLKLNNNADAE